MSEKYCVRCGLDTSDLTEYLCLYGKCFEKVSICNSCIVIVNCTAGVFCEDHGGIKELGVKGDAHISVDGDA